VISYSDLLLDHSIVPLIFIRDINPIIAIDVLSHAGMLIFLQLVILFMRSVMTFAFQATISLDFVTTASFIIIAIPAWSNLHL
jgi:hypothetical protein